MKHSVLHLLFILLCSGGVVQCNESLEQRLRLHLLHGYDKHSLPSTNHTQVTLRFTVRGVNMVEIEDVMELDAWIMMTWLDPRLAWSEATAQHVAKLSFPVNSVWHPDISLFNNADPPTEGVIPGDSLLLVYHTGIVLYVYPSRLRIPCVADLTNWPYDTHNCSAKYGSWVHDGLAVDLDLHDNAPEVEIDFAKSFQEDRNLTRGQWKVLGSSLQKSTMFYDCCDEPYPHVTLRMVVQRNAPSYAYTIQIPAVALSLVTAVVYVLPPAAVEKVVVGALCLVLNLQFILFTTASVPHSPSHTPLIVKFVSQQLLVTAVTVFVSAIVVRMVKDPHHDPLPRWCQRMLAVLAACCCLGSYRRLASKSAMAPYPQGLKGEDLELGEDAAFTTRTTYSNGPTTGNPVTSSPNNNTCHNRSAPYDYLLLGAVVDRVCLVLYLFVVVGNLITFSSVLFS